MNEQCTAMERQSDVGRLVQCANRATHCEEVEPGVRFPVCDKPHVFIERRAPQKALR